jgi:hypothetical protein
MEMFYYETHMHTFPSSACACASPSEQVAAYKGRGYTGIIVTDHFTNGNSGCSRGGVLPWEEKMAFFAQGYEDAKAAGDVCGLDVFFGLEFCVGEIEFLTYGLTPALLYNCPDLDQMGSRAFSAFVRKAGGYLAQAHPYRTAPWITKSEPVNPKLIDGMEVFNAGDIGKDCNSKAEKFARKHGIPMQAGSDSHLTVLPFASGIGLKKRAGDIFDIIEAIKKSEVTLIKE